MPAQLLFLRNEISVRSHAESSVRESGTFITIYADSRRQRNGDGNEKGRNLYGNRGKTGLP
jgi:hypothetical protein